MCSSFCIKKLYHKNKDKLISDVRMAWNVACVDNLSKQKVKPALALFSKEITTALKNEHDEKAQGTHGFLEMFQDYIIEPLLTVSKSKESKIKESSVFEQPDDVRMSDQSSYSENNEANHSTCNKNDSISLFLDNEEMNESIKENNKSSENNEMQFA